LRHAPAAIGEAYCASRLEGGYGGALGALPASVDTAALIARRITP
jgi:putative acyl-CoA dehydrogenase